MTVANRKTGLSSSVQVKKSASLIVGLYELTALFVALVSVVSIISICLSYFDIRLVLGVSFIISWLIILVFRVRIEIRVILPSAILLTILIPAVVFRTDVYEYLMGGQDQGIYTNMATVLREKKSLYFVDTFRSSLPKELRKEYDKEPLAGLSFVDENKSRMTFDFYPLHPVWMAITGWILGDRYQTLSLFFFWALSIWGGYHLTRLIAGTEGAALTAVALLSWNPALVFFSKFPVSEMVALSFSINAFVFWARAEIAQSSRETAFNMACSVLCFIGYFFTRIQFFMFVPFLLIVLLGCAIPLRDIQRRMTTVIFIAVIMFFFVLSLVFYYVFQESLFIAMKPYILALITTSIKWVTPVVVLGCLVTATAAIVYRKTSLQVFANWANRFQVYSPWALTCALFLSIVSIIALYQTGDLYPEVYSIQQPASDPLLIRYHVLYRLMLLLSPVGLVLLIVAGLLIKPKKPLLSLSFIFVATCWLAVLLRPTSPYLYYYARYLTSEMVPYSLILLACIVDPTDRSILNWRMGVITFMLGYFFVFSAVQTGKREGEKTSFFYKMARYITQSDVIFIESENNKLLAALRLSFGKNVTVLPLEDPNRARKLLDEARFRSGKTLLLLPRQLSIPGVKPIAKENFIISYFSNGEHLLADTTISDSLGKMILPYIYARRNQAWYLYDSADVVGDFCGPGVDLSNSGTLLPQLVGFSHAERAGRWTEGSYASFTCDVRPGDPYPRRLVLDTTAFVPTGDTRVIMSINGSEPTEIQYTPSEKHKMLKFDIPHTNSQRVYIEFLLPDAVSPKKVGLSADTRELSINVRSIQFD